MKKILSMLLVIVMLIGGVSMFSSCQNTDEPAESIVDMAGVEVNMPEKIDRVICTSQNAVEFMVAMGLEEKIVGVHRSVLSHAWTKEYIKNIQNIKGFGYSPSAEAIYEMEADLVIVKDAKTAEDLRAVGITAITFTYGNSAEMIKAVKMLASIFGGEANKFAERWIETYNETVKLLGEKLSGLKEEEKIKAYFIDASGALDAGGLTTTVGGDHIAAEWFENCGANFVTKEYSNISSINEEKILQINPELVIIGGWCANTRKEQMMTDPKWSDVTAVKNGNIYVAPVGFVSFERYAVEAPILLMYTASIMYPELVEYDAMSEFKTFFNEYFGIDVSNDKIQYMLNALGPDGERMD